MKQLTKIEVINKTVKHFQENNRSVNPDKTNNLYGTSCLYEDPSGNRCGVSIWLKESLDRKSLDNFEGGGHIFLLLKEEIITMSDFKKEVQHIDDSGFWVKIQKLHDYSNNWNGKMLTKIGQKAVDKLLETYKD